MGSSDQGCQGWDAAVSVIDSQQFFIGAVADDSEGKDTGYGKAGTYA